MDHVLCLQRRAQGRTVDTQRCQLLHRELDEDLFILGAQDFDFRDVWNAQKLRAHGFDIVAKLPMREPVGREAVDSAEGIAKIVVETRADSACGQSVADITDALAHVIPDVRHFPCGRLSLQVDEDCRDAGACKAAQKVEPRCLLQLALEPLGHLL